VPELACLWHYSYFGTISVEMYLKIWVFIEPVQKQALKFLDAASIIEKPPSLGW